MTLGIIFLLIGLPLYVYIIREREVIGQISDPVVVAFLLVCAGVWNVTEATIGPEMTSLKDFWFFVTSKELWFIVALPTILLSMTAVFIGRWLRHRKYGKPEKKPRRISWSQIMKKLKNKPNKGGVSMNYEERATEYIEKYGIVTYEINGNILSYEEVFPMEGNTYAVTVNLDTMKETRTITNPEQPREVTPLQPPENCEMELYDHLRAENRIACDFDIFYRNTQVYATPHGIYINNPMSDVERDKALNLLLNVNADDLVGYKNAVDWLMQKDERVHYIESFDLYIRVCDTENVTITPANETEESA